MQHATIEERVALLEIQVVEIEEDLVGLDQDVNFLFEEQIIQDERLLNLEEEINVFDEELERKYVLLSIRILSKNIKVFCDQKRNCF